jgi:hypothetical protein
MADRFIELGPVFQNLRHQFLFDGATLILGETAALDQLAGVFPNNLDGEWMAGDFLCCDSH